MGEITEVEPGLVVDEPCANAVSTLPPTKTEASNTVLYFIERSFDVIFLTHGKARPVVKVPAVADFFSLEVLGSGILRVPHRRNPQLSGLERPI